MSPCAGVLRVVAIVLPSLVLPAVALAQQDAGGGAEAAELETEARARFQLGQLYYSQARFAEAASEFEAAYAIHPHPLLLHNVYLARRDLGDLPGAVDALTRYIAEATDLSASDRRLLEGRLATMRRQIAATRPSGDGEAPEERDADAEPDRATEAPDAADPDATDPDATAGQARAGAALGAPDTPPPAGGLGVAPGAVVISIGAAALIAAAIAGGVALSVQSERDGMCTLPGGACPASLDQAAYASRFAEARDAGWGLLIAGGVTAAVGAVLIAAGVSAPSESVEVGAACDGAGCAAVVSGSF